MRDHHQAVRDAGGSIAAIGLAGRRYAREFREETGISFPLLIDADRQAYQAAELRSATVTHLLRGENFKARNRAKAAGHKQHRLGANPMQLGGSFVFGPGNEDLFVHVSETFGDNAQPEDLLGAF